MLRVPRLTTCNRKMITTRYKSDNTSNNLAAIVSLINDPECQRIFLFASPANFIEGAHDNAGGPDANLPLVAALAEFKIHGIDKIRIVFDGVFLTAARSPRYYEVRQLLDAAQASNKVFYGQERAPFTSDMDSTAAADELSKIAAKGYQQLTDRTRTAYFSLLSSVPEKNQP